MPYNILVSQQAKSNTKALKKVKFCRNNQNSIIVLMHNHNKNLSRFNVKPKSESPHIRQKSHPLVQWSYQNTRRLFYVTTQTYYQRTNRHPIHPSRRLLLTRPKTA